MGKLALLHGVWTELQPAVPGLWAHPGAEQAVEVITRYLQRWGLQYHCHEYEHTSWLPGDPPRLAWDGREREAYVMLGSPGGAGQRTLKRNHRVCGLWAFGAAMIGSVFALVSPQAELLAYIAGGRRQPSPRPCPWAVTKSLYLGIGSADVQELLLAHQTGRVVTATLEANPSFGAVQIAAAWWQSFPAR